jgi:hypothetical protein
VAFCDAGARVVDVAEAVPVDDGEAFPVDRAVAVPVARAVDVAEAVAVPVCDAVDVADGEKIDGAVLLGELKHPETSVETRIAKITQLTVRLALADVPAGIMRTFMTPPYMPGGRPYR